MLILPLSIIASVTWLGCRYDQGFLQFTWLPQWFPNLSTFGMMMAISFYAGNVLIQKEFERLNIPAKLGDNIIVIGVIAGLSGSKLAYLVESYHEFIGWKDLLDRTFSGGGLTWYGGFLLAGISISILIRRRGFTIANMGDILSPALAIGYGVGRLGCMVSGDGCYGVACHLPIPAPFAMSFPNGAAPWSEVVAKYNDPNVVVYNTPLFEALFSLAVCWLLWSQRKKSWPEGVRFIMFILLHAIFRFFVEFIRQNPRDVFGISQAQFVSLVAIIVCLVLLGLRLPDLRKMIHRQPAPPSGGA